MRKTILSIITALLPFVLTAQVYLTVNPNDSRQQAVPEMYGVNFQFPFDPKVSENEAFQQRLSELNTPLVRYHASEIIKPPKYLRKQSDGTFIMKNNPKSWLVDTTGFYHLGIDIMDLEMTWDTAKIRRVMATRPVNATIMITVANFPFWLERDSEIPYRLATHEYGNYAAWLAQLLDFLKNDLGVTVTYFEPFNEKDENTHYFGEADMAALAELFDHCYDSLKAVDPNVQVTGPIFRDGWKQDAARDDIDFFLENVTNLDAWSHHHYGGPPIDTANLSLEERIVKSYDRADGMIKPISSIRSKLNKNGFSNVPVFITEWNIIWTWDGDPDDFMVTDVGGVYDALSYKYVLEASADRRIDALFAWNCVDNDYGKIRGNKNGYDRLNPGGYVLKVLSEFGTGTAKFTGSSDNNLVEGFAIERSEGGYLYAIMNRTVTKQQFVFKSGGWKPSNDLSVKKITIDSLYAESTVQWDDFIDNNLTIPPKTVYFFVTDTEGTIPNYTPTADAGGNKTVTLPYQNFTNGNRLVLNGRGTDVEDSLLNNFEWTLLNGTETITLEGANTANLAVSNLSTGSYTFNLKVTDSGGENSVDQVSVHVIDSIAEAVINDYSFKGRFEGKIENNDKSFSGAVSSYSADGGVVLSQNDELEIQINSLNKYKKILELKFLDHSLLNLSENARVRFDIKSDIDVDNLQIKLFDNKGRQIDTYKTQFDIEGNGLYKPVEIADFAKFIADDNAFDISQVAGLILMTTKDMGSANIAMDNLWIGEVEPENLMPQVAANNKLVRLPFNHVIARAHIIDPNTDDIIEQVSWEQVSGPSTLELNNIKSENVSNTKQYSELAVANLVAGTYLLKIVAKDQLGATGESLVTIKVLDSTSGPTQINNHALLSGFEGNTDDIATHSGENTSSATVTQNDEITVNTIKVNTYKDIYRLKLKEGAVIDLSGNATVSFDIKTDTRIKNMQVRLFSANGKLIKSKNKTIEIGDTYQTITINFLDNSQLDGADDKFDLKNVNRLSLFYNYWKNPLEGSTIKIDNIQLGDYQPYVAVGGVEITPDNSFTLKPNLSLQAAATVTPANASNLLVNWSSADTSVAIVNPNGLITALNPGTTFIKVSTVEGNFIDSLQLIVPENTDEKVYLPIADAQVIGGWLKYFNFGKMLSLSAHKSRWQSGNSQSYIKFAVDPAEIAGFQKAKLKLHVQGTYAQDGATTIAIYGTDDNSWTETGISFANAPDTSTAPLAISELQSGCSVNEFEVTEFTMANTANELSFMMKNIDETSSRAYFSSREVTQKSPKLVLTRSNLNFIPKNLEAKAEGGLVRIEWDAPDIGTQTGYRIYANYVYLTTVTEETALLDFESLNGFIQISALYASGFESDYNQVHVGSATILVPVIEDAYVQGGSNSSTNFGASTTMLVKESNNSDYDRKAYLKFAKPEDYIGGGTLRLFATEDTQEGFTVSVHEVSDNSWNENTITWATQPNSSGTAAIGSFKIANDIDFAIEAGSYLSSVSGNEVSFLLKTSADKTGKIYSKENGVKIPELEVDVLVTDSIQKIDLNGIYVLKNVYNHKFMDVDSDNKLKFKSTPDGEDRKIEFIHQYDNIFKIRSKQYDKCIYARSDNSPRVGDCSSTSSSRLWRVTKNGEYYKIESLSNPGRYLGINSKGWLYQVTNTDTKTDWEITFSESSALRVAALPKDESEAAEQNQQKNIQFPKVDLYPNPASDFLNVAFQSKFTESSEVRIIDLTGRVAYEGIFRTVKGANELIIPLNKIKPGFYSLSIQSKTIHQSVLFVVSP